MSQSQTPNVETIENELNRAREAFRGRRETEMIGAKVKSVRFYHNSKTRHNGGTFILDNGKEVYKEFRETDFLTLVSCFTAVRDLTVWYDKAGVVQQFVLNHNY